MWIDNVVDLLALTPAWMKQEAKSASEMSSEALLMVLIVLLISGLIGQAEGLSSSEGLPDAAPSVELQSGRLQLYPLLNIISKRYIRSSRR